MRGKLFILFSLFICLFVSSEITGDLITGEIITGEATSQSLDISILVGGVPSLVILSPVSTTYFTNVSLLLNYSESGSDNLWYNFNDGANNSISNPIYFNISAGTHTLNLYANNSYGVSKKNVTFVVDPSMWIIYYDEFNGSTTNFNNYSDSSLGNLSGVILENSIYGKIEYNESINVSLGKNSTNNIIDINTNANISYNRIEVVASGIPGFNSSAVIYFYNLSYSIPQLLKDGSVCSDCSLYSYSSLDNWWAFLVSDFNGVYTTQETPADEVTVTVTTSGGGGGGGGSTTTVTQTTYFDLDIITPGRATMEVNDQLVIPVTLSNPFDGVRLEGINIKAYPDFDTLSVRFDRDYIESLDPGEKAKLNLFIKSKSFAGEYQIDLNLTVKNPNITENEKVFIRTVEDLGEDFIRERLEYVTDLFKENPECLEFNDYLLEAEKIIESDPEKAKEFVDFAITGCRDLITSKEGAIQKMIPRVTKEDWKNPVIASLALLIIFSALAILFFRYYKKKKAFAKIRAKNFKKTSSKKFSFFRKFFKKKKKSSAKSNKFVFGR